MSSLKSRFAAENARALRGRMTDAELKFWFQVRNRRFLGFKFARQVPVGPYVADFACRQANLIVEIDGGQHGESETDAQRTRVLAEHGYALIRFWNRDILKNMDGVLAILQQHLEKAPSPGQRFALSDRSPRGEVRGSHTKGS